MKFKHFIFTIFLFSSVLFAQTTLELIKKLESSSVKEREAALKKLVELYQKSQQTRDEAKVEVERHTYNLKYKLYRSFSKKIVQSYEYQKKLYDLQKVQEKLQMDLTHLKAKIVGIYKEQKEKKRQANIARAELKANLEQQQQLLERAQSTQKRLQTLYQNNELKLKNNYLRKMHRQILQSGPLEVKDPEAILWAAKKLGKKASIPMLHILLKSNNKQHQWQAASLLCDLTRSKVALAFLLKHLYSHNISLQWQAAALLLKMGESSKIEFFILKMLRSSSFDDRKRAIALLEKFPATHLQQILSQFGFINRVKSPAVKNIEEKLKNTPITLSFTETPFSDVFRFIQTVTNINIFVTPQILEKWERQGVTVDFYCQDVALADTIDILSYFYGFHHFFAHDTLIIDKNPNSFSHLYFVADILLLSKQDEFIKMIGTYNPDLSFQLVGNWLNIKASHQEHKKFRQFLQTIRGFSTPLTIVAHLCQLSSKTLPQPHYSPKNFQSFLKKQKVLYHWQGKTSNKQPLELIYKQQKIYVFPIQKTNSVFVDFSWQNQKLLSGIFSTKGHANLTLNKHFPLWVCSQKNRAPLAFFVSVSGSFSPFSFSTVESAYERHIKTRLASQVSIDFNNTPLLEITDFFRNILGINITVHPRVAKKFANSKHTIYLKKVSASKALETLLAPHNLRYAIYKSFVVIDFAGKNSLISDWAIYNIASLLFYNSPQEIQKAIASFINFSKLAINFAINSKQKNILLRGPKKDIQKLTSFLRQMTDKNNNVAILFKHGQKNELIREDICYTQPLTLDIKNKGHRGLCLENNKIKIWHNDLQYYSDVSMNFDKPKVVGKNNRWIILKNLQKK